MVFYLLMFPLLTMMQTSLWGQPLTQALTWAERHPDSRFAHTHTALILNDYRQYDAAKARHQYIIDNFKNAEIEYLYMQYLACKQKDTASNNNAYLKKLLLTLDRPIRLDLDMLSGLNLLINEYRNKCSLIVKQDIYVLFELLLKNRINDSYLAYFYQAFARLYSADHNNVMAVHYLDLALSLNDKIQVRLQKIHLLMAMQKFSEALDFIQASLQQLSDLQRPIYQPELQRTEQLLQELIELEQQYSLKKQESNGTINQHHSAVSE